MDARVSTFYSTTNASVIKTVAERVRRVNAERREGASHTVDMERRTLLSVGHYRWRGDGMGLGIRPEP